MSVNALKFHNSHMKERFYYLFVLNNLKLSTKTKAGIG